MKNWNVPSMFNVPLLYLIFLTWPPKTSYTLFSTAQYYSLFFLNMRIKSLSPWMLTDLSVNERNQWRGDSPTFSIRCRHSSSFSAHCEYVCGCMRRTWQPDIWRKGNFRPGIVYIEWMSYEINAAHHEISITVLFARFLWKHYIRVVF